MADAAEIRLVARYSENTDYSSPEWTTLEWDAYTITPDEGELRTTEAATGGTTINIAQYASMTFLAIKNKDTTNFVTATWTDTAASSNSQKIPAGGLLVVPDVDPTAANLVLTADTAACLCKVAMAGS